MKAHDLLKIEWHDAICDSGWTCEEDVKDKVVESCTTVGYLIEETKECYKLTSTIGIDGRIIGYIIIPKGMKVKVTKL